MDKYKKTIYNLVHLNNYRDEVFINHEKLQQDIDTLWELYNKYQELIDNNQTNCKQSDSVSTPTPYQRHHYLITVTNDIAHCSNNFILYATATEVVNIVNQFNKPENTKTTYMHMSVCGKDDHIYG